MNASLYQNYWGFAWILQVLANAELTMYLSRIKLQISMLSFQVVLILDRTGGAAQQYSQLKTEKAPN